MNKAILLLFFSGFFLPAFAKHITGGEVTYKFLGMSGTSARYSVTLILFRDNTCVNCSVMPANVGVGLYNNDNNHEISITTINLGAENTLPIVERPQCLTNEPLLNYSAGYYTYTLTLPANNNGYTVVYQTCCRVDGITNIGAISLVGATYTGSIPGNATLQGGVDNSAQFQIGISILCNNKRFILDFSATDDDHDSLVYSFADAYDGGQATDASFADPAPPPYGTVPYGPSPYDGQQPLGASATINPNTGIISGIAPAAGKYIVCVVVKSYRNGLFVAAHRKDFIVTVAPCDFASADLPAIIPSCSSFDKSFSDESSSALNLTFFWTFGDPASGTLDSSTQESPTHHYTTAGDFNLTLIVNRGTPCADTAHSVVKVYPGFFPAVKSVPPMCKDMPVQFTDSSRTNYGRITYRFWDFGDPRTLLDTSHLQNPTYTYHNAGTYNVLFIVSSDKGCTATLFPAVVVTIVDKPDFRIFPKDTLICIVDTLQIRTNVSTGTIAWSPNYSISDIHSFNPFVSPDITTTYSALYSDPFGCTITDSVRVRVTSGVALSVQGDTTICRTDPATLHVTSNALYYSWTPGNVIADSTAQNPVVKPVDPLTHFHVRASISAKCFNDGDVTVRTVPYPNVVLAGDSNICFGNSAQLHASGGAFYTWTPIAYLNNANIPDPISQHPKADIVYTVTVTDTLGCPKPVSKNFPVNVIRLVPDAGPQDTSIVLGQPLQLHATGGDAYVWTPVTYLSDPTIANPVASPPDDITYRVRVSDEAGCAAFDTIRVHVFFEPPGLYVPSAFTPGKDGLNDVFRPIALGIKSLLYFRVYNRWGALMYETSEIGRGWDGTYQGKGLDTATFVWQAAAVDYKGKNIYLKGTVILIR